MLQFTAVRYDRQVEASRQATFEYAFTPSETFNARPFGLTINLNYKDGVSHLCYHRRRFHVVSLNNYDAIENTVIKVQGDDPTVEIEQINAIDKLLQEGNLFQDAVFNETINIVDADEGLDGET